MRKFSSLFRRCRSRRIQWPRLLLISSLEIIVAFSAFGYIMISPVSITFVTLPVLIGAFFLGPIAGLILGTLFGLTSIWKASVTATLYADIIFSPFRSGQFFDSLILALGARMAFGLLAGHLYVWAQRCRQNRMIAIISATVTSLFVHSMLVYSIIDLRFPEVGFTALRTVEKLFSLEGLVNWLLFSGVILFLDYARRLDKVRRIAEIVRQIDTLYSFRQNVKFNVGCLIVLSGISLSLFYHFLLRTKAMLAYNNIYLSAEIYSIIIEIGLQFLVAVFALVLILVIFVIYFERYSRQMANRAERDALTGLYNRGASSDYIREALALPKPGQHLMLIDIDDFKNINDTYGHPVGDAALQSVAAALSRHFTPPNIIGRLGGDEFVVYIEDPDFFDNNCIKVKKFLHDVGQIIIGDNKSVSCSIGIVKVVAGCNDRENLYSMADEALYCAKNNGKNGFVVYEK